MTKSTLLHATAAVLAALGVRWCLQQANPRARKTKTACERQADVGKLAALRCGKPRHGLNSGVHYNLEHAPLWLQYLFDKDSLRRVLLREWEDPEWRQRSGWHGCDLIHSLTGDGVRIHAYFWDETSKILTGIASFGPGAESHRGLCHGGAMTSLMDDLCGHICFINGDGPWCGATVQVNCKLSKPVRVGDILRVTGKIEKVERKKVSITARLEGHDGSLYATLEGLSITPVSMGEIDDAVDHRTWETAPGCMFDSGWRLPMI